MNKKLIIILILVFILILAISLRFLIKNIQQQQQPQEIEQSITPSPPIITNELIDASKYPYILKQPTSYQNSHFEGSNFIFRATAKQWSNVYWIILDPEYKYYCNGTEIGTVVKETNETSALNIPNITKDLNGYYVMAFFSNQYGTINSNKVEIIIQKPDLKVHQIYTTHINDGGFSSTSVKQATAGQYVTIDISLKDGYDLRSIYITTMAEEIVSVNKITDTKYSFIMPNEDAYIDITFNCVN